MAGDMERELADGHLATPDSTSTDPAFRYVMKSGEAIPLDRASSSILELVPLVMAVRSVLASGDQLIIEEPEAHLHPAKQRILAKYLVRLVRAGVRLLITTHSDYLLEQISNAVALGGLAEVDPRAKEGDYLRADEVAVHLFKPTKERGGGYMIDRVEVDQTEGIDMEEFNKVVDSLYDETYRLRTAIAKAKKTKK
jgi:predicted ATPase